jgi:autotransporter-associated beta strand protein
VVLAGSSGLTVSSPDGRLWAQATYTGDTVVNSGTLRLAGVGGIPTNSAVSIASGAAVNLTSFFAPTNINRTIGGLTGAGVLYGAGGTVTVNKTSGSDTFSGDIQGGNGLIKAGAGTLVLAANNTYTGGTTINTGTAQGKNYATVYARLVPRSERKRSTKQLSQPLREQLARIPGITITHIGALDGVGGDNKQIRFSILGPDLKQLGKLAEVGLLKREKRGNQQVYSADTSAPIFTELASILRKTSGLADVLEYDMDEQADAFADVLRGLARSAVKTSQIP